MVDVQASKSIDGVEDVYYLLPKKDAAGKPTSEMRDKTYKKTIYDVNIISTEEYIRRGLQAANNADGGKRLNGRWTGEDSEGVVWQGYTQDGKITTFYPRA